MKPLPTAEAAAAAGMTYQELASWIDRRVIEPTRLGQPGVPHQFEKNAVILLSIAVALHACGLAPRLAMKHAELFFRDAGGQLHPTARTWLVVDGPKAQILRIPYGKRPEDVTDIGPATLQADLDAVVETMEQRWRDAA